MKSITVAVFTLLAGALMLSNQGALAGDCCDDGFGNTAIYSLSRIRTKGWIELHRPDGEVVHIQVDQIVLVMRPQTQARTSARSQEFNWRTDLPMCWRALTK